MAGFLLVGVAAASWWCPGEHASVLAEEPTSLTQTLLPYLPLAAAAGLTFGPALTGHRLDAPALISCALVLVLVLGRQYLVLADNHRLLRRVRRQAFHDELTGLANRAVFLDRLRHAVELHRRDRQTICVIFIDLDDFKHVNDSLGHDVGDKLLERAAERLRACVRAGDTIARLGGDEFAILLEGELVTPRAVLARLRDAFAVPVSIDGRQIAVSASLGVRIASPGEPGGADALLRDADVAMYETKRRGKGGYTVFEESMHARALDQFELRADIPAALANDEFELVYQPIYDLRTGLMAGAEALLRWRHPRRGWLTPDRFLTAVDDTGAIIEIGRRTLRRRRRAAAAMDRPPARRPGLLRQRQPLRPTTPRRSTGRLGARRHRHPPARRRATRARNHRDHTDRRPGRGRDRAGPPARPRRPHRPRRLRHRLLLAELPGRPAGTNGQNRPFLHREGHRRLHRPAAGRRDRQPVQPPSA